MQRNDMFPSSAVAITKSDTDFVDLVGFYVGGTGDVAVKCSPGGTAVTFKAVPVGTVINLRVVQVMSTNTTATLIVGLVA